MSLNDHDYLQDHLNNSWKGQTKSQKSQIIFFVHSSNTEFYNIKFNFRSELHITHRNINICFLLLAQVELP